MQLSPDATKANLTFSLFMMLLLYSSLGQVAADMYVPSLPAIAAQFGNETSAIQLTLSVYIFGFSISQLIYGPLSDRYGRRPPMLIGVGIGMAGTVICLFAPSVYILILGRFIQGAGIGVCNSVGRSLTRDILSGTHLAKIGSHIGMAAVLLLAIAPTIGGYIQDYLGWRAIFFILFIYTFCIWLFMLKTLPETNRYLNPEATKIKIITSNYRTLITNKTFIGYTICASAAYAGLIAYFTAAPFLLQTVVGLTPVEFGWLAFLTSGALFLTMFINSRLIVKVGIARMIFVGNLLMLSGGILMLVFGLLGYINTFVIMFPVILFAMGAGLTFSNAFAGAFHPFPRMAGVVGAVYGCLQILGGSITSALIASLHENNQLPLSYILIFMGLAALFSLRLAANDAGHEQ